MDRYLTLTELVDLCREYGFLPYDLHKVKASYNAEVQPFVKSGSKRVLDCVIHDKKIYVYSNRNTDEPFSFDSSAFTSLDDLEDRLGTFSEFWYEEPPVVEKTEVEQEILRRRGQDKYRDKLMEYWDGKCALTGISNEELLIGSHAKAWKYANSKERLDVFNGFLFEARIDKLFDKYLISFDNNGKIMISSKLSNSDINLLGLQQDMHLSKLDKRHIPYLEYHRNIFLHKEKN